MTITIHKSQTNPKLSTGYTIQYGEQEYSAGGNLHDSQAMGESPINDVKTWALSTARDIIAERHGRAIKKNDYQIIFN